MILEAIERLDYLCNTIPPLLWKVDDLDFNTKMSADKWSKKEILGHLIDSATNNHHRYVRGQFEEQPEISYDQNNWNKHNYYQQLDTQQLISFWSVYNKQLLAIIRAIPIDYLNRNCKVGNNLLTIDFLINDYVKHLEHHLKQLVEY